MTALPQPGRVAEGQIRVLAGRRRRRPTMAPWMIVAIIAVIGFLGLGFARTSLDRAAFDLAELNTEITEQRSLKLSLEMEIARLENPARIAPLAEKMGLVIPTMTHQLLVDLDGTSPAVAGADTDESNQ
ncbi:MAG: hypothetical protein L0Z49_11625 [Actinobacteria bacterium]|nr:hypothetical protein [Actinomycetota bacterium]MCI0677709.1 hypothetical protein [Actinomycetota bacterium]